MACPSYANYTVENSEIDTSAGTVNLGNGSTTTYWACKFNAANTYDVARVVTYMNKVGSPTFSIYASIWTDFGGTQPLAQIGVESAAVDSSTIGASEEAVVFSFADPYVGPISSGTEYWLVLRVDSTDASNYVQWHYETSGAVERIDRSSNGAAWVNASVVVTLKYCIYSTTISSSSSSSRSSSHSSSSSSNSSVSSSSSRSSGVSTVRFGDSTAETMDYPGTQDTDITYPDSLENAGNAQAMLLGSYLTTSTYRGLIAFDLKSFYEDYPYATITAARLKMRCIEKDRD